MRCSVMPENLQAAVAIVGKISNKYSPDVFIEAHHANLSIAASDGSTLYLANIGAKVEQEGVVATQFKTFKEVLSMVSSERLDIKVNGDYSLHLNCGLTNSNVRSVTDADLPKANEPADGISFYVQSDVLKQALARVIPCAAKDGGRPLLMGVNISIEGDKATLCCVDGYKLALDVVYIDNPADMSGEWTIPATIMKDVLSTLSSDGGTVVVCLGKKRGGISIDSWMEFWFDLISGVFPVYDTIIPTHSEVSVTVPMSGVNCAVKAAAAFVDGGAGGINVALGSDDDGLLLIVSSKSAERGNTETGVYITDSEVTGDCGTILLLVDHIKGLLSCIDRDEVEISATNPKSPLKFTMPNTSFIGVLMPASGR